MAQLMRILWGVFLFTFPFSLRFLVFEDWSYRFGHFNPWVSGFFYAPEVLLFLCLGVFLFLALRKRAFDFSFDRRVFLLLFLLSAVILLTGFFKDSLVLALFYVLRLFEASAVYLLITRGPLSYGETVRVLFYGVIFQVILGFFQWAFNRSMGLVWLGEPVLLGDLLGAAKRVLATGASQLRAYGTFLHPNILAATVLMVTSFACMTARHERRFYIGFMGVAALFLTFSRTAFAAVLFLGLLLFLWKRFPHRRRLVQTGVLCFLVALNVYLFAGGAPGFGSGASSVERRELNQISRRMVLREPLGVGPGRFTLALEGAEGVLKPWQYQPVHNVYLLILSELGVPGLLLILLLLWCLLWPLRETVFVLPVFAILFMASFDHFWWDSFAGLLNIAIALGLATLGACLPSPTPAAHRKRSR